MIRTNSIRNWPWLRLGLLFCLAKELDIDESYLEKLTAEVRKDLR
jgi:hypothetical protein